MRLRFWGVRGSIPAPGAHTHRYGGNTSCVEIWDDGQPSILFDCGTGARLAGQTIIGRPQREMFLLFSHFHMDHLFGFPFFAPVFAPSFRIEVTAPAFSIDATRDRIARYLNGVYHPLRVSDVMCDLSFDHVRPGQAFVRGPYEVLAVQLNHPGGSCGYVARHRDRSFAYLTDSAPLSRPGEGLAGGNRPTPREQRLLQAIRGVDAVAFDTMFSEAEYLEKMSWGHAYPEYAVALCREAGVRQLFLFHHSPDARDEDLDVLAERWSKETALRVTVAREGVDVDLEG